MTKNKISSQELDAEHTRLLKRFFATDENTDSQELVETIRKFVESVRTLGSRLFNLSQREKAQGILDFWSTQLISYDQQLRRPFVLDDPDSNLVPDLTEVESPFVGLLTFQEKQSNIFFGRSNAANELYSSITSNSPTILTGSSGSGKSSLIRAGLLPLLRQSGSGSILALPILQPGERPLDRLARLITSEFDSYVGRSSDLAQKLRKKPKYLSKILSSRQKRCLLIIDQFEELFTLSKARSEESLAFCKAIASICSEHQLLISVREDYNTRTVERMISVGIETPIETYRPPVLINSELRQIITKPADAVGLEFEQGIVSKLIAEVQHEPAALPLLQFTLLRLWEHKDRNRITWDIYKNVVGSPREALGRAADEALGSLRQFENSAKEVFLQLVEPGVGSDFLRRRVSRGRLHIVAPSDSVDNILDRFEKAGLLRRTEASEREGDIFEVSHEALIRNWPKLYEWLEAKREKNQEVMRFKQFAYLWKKEGEDNDYLLKGELLRQGRVHRIESPELSELIEESEKQRRRHIRRRILSFFVMAVLVSAAVSTWQTLRNKNVDLADEKEKGELSSSKAAGAWQSEYSILHNIFATQNEKIIFILDELESAKSQDEVLESAGQIRAVVLKNEALRTEKDPAILNEQIEDIRKGLTETSDGRSEHGELSNEVPDALKCTGAIWLGTAGKWNTTNLINRSEQDVSELLIDEEYWINKRVEVTANVSLRDGLPDRNAYKSKDRIGTVLSNVSVTATSAPAVYNHRGEDRYWLPISAEGQPCNTMYFHYKNGSPEIAAELASELAPLYFIPLEKEVSALRDYDKVEIRYFNESDDALANQTKVELTRVLTKLASKGLIRSPIQEIKISNLSTNSNYTGSQDERSIEVYFNLE